MASKRRVRRNMCGGKVQFVSQATAAIASKQMRSRGERMAYYRCKWCGFYHIGHPDKRARQSLRARRKVVT